MRPQWCCTKGKESGVPAIMGWPSTNTIGQPEGRVGLPQP